MEHAIVSSESNTVCCLTPSERNLHQIVPAPSCQLPAVIADVICPPYTAETDSSFYDIIDTVYDSTLGKPITWLYPVDVMPDFYCDTIAYSGPPIVV